ncbi:MAG: DUF433 domain-containing protein [Acidobacteria bacterium]|nr:DUF433 domain-containing protein [Acidobacteriota bacterium]
MSKEYAEQRDSGYWIKGSRVSLDSIVYAFLRGASPESIAHSFPLISLEEVYGFEASESPFSIRDNFGKYVGCFQRGPSLSVECCRLVDAVQ